MADEFDPSKDFAKQRADLPEIPQLDEPAPPVGVPGGAIQKKGPKAPGRSLVVRRPGGIARLPVPPNLRAFINFVNLVHRGYELLPKDWQIVGPTLDWLKQQGQLSEPHPLARAGIGYFQDLFGLAREDVPEGGITTLMPWDPQSGKYQLPPVYGSALADAVDKVSWGRYAADPSQVLATLRGTEGVKEAELEYRGLGPYLRNKIETGGKVSKQEVQDILAANPVSIKDIIRGGEAWEAKTLTWEDLPNLDPPDVPAAATGLATLRIQDQLRDSGRPVAALIDPEFGYRIYKHPSSARLRSSGSNTNRYSVYGPDSDAPLPWSEGRYFGRTLEEAKILAQRQAVRDGHLLGDKTIFSEETLGRGRGLQNYREILMQLPPRTGAGTTVERYEELNNIAARRNLTESESEEMVAIERAEFSGESGTAGEDFVGGHFPDKNYFAHLRVSDRETVAGNDVTLVDEIQGDWPQRARDLRKEEIKRVTLARFLKNFDPDPSYFARLQMLYDVDEGLTPDHIMTLDDFIDDDEDIDRNEVAHLIGGEFGKAWDAAKEEAKELVPKNFGYKDPERLALLKEQRAKILAERDTAAEDARMSDWLPRLKELADKRVGESLVGLTPVEQDEYSRLVAKRGKFDDETRAALREINSQISSLLIESIGAVPDMPFKKTWHELAFRRALRLAAEEGKDSLAWTPGDMQVARYGLTGDEAKGMRKFYDVMIKNYANKFGKKFGVKAGMTEIYYSPTNFLSLGGKSTAKVWSLKITPKMRRHLLGKGIQKFTHGGFVDKPLYEDARMIG